MQKQLVTLLMLTCWGTLFGQFDIEWSKRIFSPQNSYADIRAGVVVGDNAIFTGGVNSNFYLTEVNPDGVVINERIYDAGGRIEVGRDIAYENNQFAIAGFILNQDNDYRCVLTDRNANLTNDLIFPERGYQQLWQITALIDGYILGGITDNGVNTTTDRSFGLLDFEVIKINRNGQIQWRKTFGGPSDDLITDLATMPNGDILILGLFKEDFNVPQKGYIARLNPQGDILWDKLLGGNQLDGSSYGALHVDDAGDIYAIVDAGSGRGGNKTEPNFGQTDAWILKLDGVGNIIWQQNYGGTLSEKGNTITSLPNGQLFVGTITGSGQNGNKPFNSIGENDIWFKILSKDTGERVAESLIGGSDKDDIYVVLPAPCGVYVGGVTYSEDGDFDQPIGRRVQDGFILKLGNDLRVELPADESVCSNREFAIEPVVGDICYNCVYEWENGSNEVDRSILLDQDSLLVLRVSEPTFGCTNEDRMFLTKREGPVFDLADTNVVICNAVPVSLTATGEADRIIWRGPSFFSSDPTISITQPGNYSFEATNFNGCSFGPVDIVASTGPLPRFDLGQDSFFCGAITPIEKEINLTDVQYVWNDGDTTSSKSFDQPGTYALTVSNRFGCFKTDSFTIIQYLKPDLSQVRDTFTCSGEFIELGASVNAPGKLWSTGEQSDILVTNTPGTYQLTAWNNPSCTDSTQFTIVERLNPEFTLGTDTVFCDTVIPFSTSLVGDVTWNTGEKQNNYEFSSEGQFIATVLNEQGCSAMDTLNITVLETPSMEPIEDTVLCNGAPIEIAPQTNAQNFLWSTSDITRNLTVESQGTYDLVYWNSPMCKDSLMFDVAADDFPNLSTSSDTTLCSSELPITLTATTDVNTLLWSTTDTESEITVDTGGRFLVNAISPLGCVTRDSIYVTALRSPILASISDTVLCGEEEMLTLNLTNQADSILWSTGEITPILNVFEAGMYGVEAKNTNGCQDALNFTVERAPIPTFELGNDRSFCSGDSIEIGISATESYTYVWNDYLNVATRFVSEPGRYWLNAVSDRGCSFSDSIDIGEDISPSLSAIDDLEWCQNDSVLITPTVQDCPDCLYDWELAETSEPSFYLKLDKSENITLKATGANGCFDKKAFSASIVPQPTIDLVVDSIACAEVDYPLSFQFDAKDNPFNIVFNLGKEDIVIANEKTYYHKPEDDFTFRLKSVEILGTSTTCQTFYDDSISVFYQPITRNEETVFLCPDEFAILNGEETREAGTFVNQTISEEGCLVEKTELTIQTDDKELLFDLPTVRRSGQELEIILNNSLDFDSISWQGPNGECLNCDTYNLAASGIMNIAFSARDANNCNYDKLFELVTPWDSDVIIPNVIKSSSEENNFQLFFTDRVKEIEDFKIFDRWGSLIYEQETDLPQNIFWDGNYRTESLKSNVVICKFLIVYEDGSKELFVQDITILK